MADKRDRHLSDDDLLRYVDGEVRRERPLMLRHLQACWGCRRRLSDLECTIRAIVEFRDENYLPAIPPPPKPWDSLQPRLRRRLQNRELSLWARLLASVRSAFRHCTLSTAIVLGVVAAAGFWLAKPQSILAAELLKQAAASEQHLPQNRGRRLVHQRWSDHGCGLWPFHPDVPFEPEPIDISGGSSPLYQIGSPRSFQMSAGFIF